MWALYLSNEKKILIIDAETVEIDDKKDRVLFFDKNAKLVACFKDSDLNCFHKYN